VGQPAVQHAVPEYLGPWHFTSNLSMHDTLQFKKENNILYPKNLPSAHQITEHIHPYIKILNELSMQNGASKTTSSQVMTGARMV
jgi:hypothetical protein